MGGVQVTLMESSDSSWVLIRFLTELNTLRIMLDKFGQNWTDLDKIGQNLDKIGHNLDKVGHNLDIIWTKLDKAGQNCKKLDRIGQNQTQLNILDHN